MRRIRLSVDCSAALSASALLSSARLPRLSGDDVMPPMPETRPDLETVCSFDFLAEAEVARSRLQAEGIAAHIRNEHIVTQNWLYRNAVGGLDLQVSSEDAERAREILQLPEPSEELDQETAAFGERAEPRCPRCGSEDVREHSYGRRWTFLSWLLLSLPIVRFGSRFRCGSCDLQWPSRGPAA